MKKQEIEAEIQRFRSAVDHFVERLAEDRAILAAVLVGSLNEVTIWRKEALWLWVIEIDGVTKRLKADGKDERIFRILVEDDINLYVELIPRTRFKQMVEGASRTAFSCNFFAHRELVYCDDPSIEQWFDQACQAAAKDQAKERLATTTWAIHGYRHAKKLLERKGDLELARQQLIDTAYAVAAMAIVRQGEVFEDLIIYRGIEAEPELMKTVYLDLLTKKPTKKALSAALESLDDFLKRDWQENLKPLIQYLLKQRRTVGLTEMSEFFAYSQLYPWHLESACEWLADEGFLEKVSAPFKLTKKSHVEVEEPAYFLDETMM